MKGKEKERQRQTEREREARELVRACVYARLRAVEPTCASDRDSEGEIDRTTKRRRKNYRVNPGEDIAFCERSVGYPGGTRDQSH